LPIIAHGIYFKKALNPFFSRISGEAAHKKGGVK